MSARVHDARYAIFVLLLPFAMGASSSTCSSSGGSSGTVTPVNRATDEARPTLRRALPESGLRQSIGQPQPSHAASSNPAPYLNLLDFGADNTGASGSETANYQAFLGAIATLCPPSLVNQPGRACGGVIWVPPGTYNLNTTLRIDQDITIMGSGWTTEVVWTGAMLSAGGVQPIVFDFVGQSGPLGERNDAGLDNIAVVAADAQPYSRGAGSDAIGVSWDRAPGPDDPSPFDVQLDGFMSRVLVAGFGTCMRLGASPPAPYPAMKIAVHDSYFTGCGIGVDLAAGINIDLFNVKSRVNDIGLLVESGIGNSMYGGIIESNLQGIVVRSAEALLVDGVYIENNDNGNIVLSTQTDSDYLKNVTFSHDRLTGPGSSIRISDSSPKQYCSMQWVTFEHLSGLPQLQIDGACKGHDITFNNNEVLLVRSPDWLRMPVFAADGFDSLGYPALFDSPPQINTFRVLDDGSLSVGASNFPSAKVDVLGIDDPALLDSTNLAPGTFHALDLTHAHVRVRNGVPGDSVAMRFLVNGTYFDAGHANDDGGASGMISVVNEGNGAGNPAPMTPRQWADMLFFTAGPGAQRGDAAQERMRIDHLGNVGIGTSTPTQLLDVAGSAHIAQSLAVEGTVTVTGSCNGCGLSGSDERYKENVKELSGVLEKLDQLHGVSYSVREPYRAKLGVSSDERQIGVIAQEVQKSFPELVVKERDGYLAVDYPRLTAVLIEAVKEQQQEQQKEVGQLRAELTRLAANLQRVGGDAKTSSRRSSQR